MSLLLLILSVHFLADFHLWPGSPDVKKHPCFRCLLPHFGMYSLILGLIFILCVSFPSAVIAWMFIILSHFITDVLTFHYYTRNHISPRSQLTAFCTSHLIHTASILAGSCFFHLPENLTETFKSLCIQVPLLQNMRYLLLVILLLTPASQFVKMLTASISLQKNPDSPKSNDSSAGSMIGKLERLIIAMLVIYGEAGAIGFVLAAKSLARYKQFEDQDFTEKFLVGTLASAAIAIALTLFLIENQKPSAPLML